MAHFFKKTLHWDIFTFYRWDSIVGKRIKSKIRTWKSWSENAKSIDQVKTIIDKGLTDYLHYSDSPIHKSFSVLFSKL